MLGAAPGSADTPRAHITNMAALGKKSMLRVPAIIHQLTILRMLERYWARAGMYRSCYGRGLHATYKASVNDLHNSDVTDRSNRWCRSMAGEEFARVYSWGNDPQRKASKILDYLSFAANPYVKGRL
jgi:hypothetical protein